jgi:ribosomal protein L18
MFACGLKQAEERQRTSIFFINKEIYLQVSRDSRQTVYNVLAQHVSSASGIF